MTEVFPPRKGGSGRWLWEIYRRFEASDVVFAVGEHRGHDNRSDEPRVYRLPLSLSTWGIFNATGMRGYVSLLRRVATLVRQHGLQVVHCGKCLPEGFIAMLLKMWKGIPYLTYVHGEELNIGAGSRELRWMTGLVLRHAQLVVANSQNTAELISGHWQVPSERLSVLHPGVDVEYFVPTEINDQCRSQLGWQDRTVVLTVGRLQVRKGQDQLIRSLQEIKQDVPNVLYAIVGDGEELDSLQELVKSLRLEQHVQFRTQADDAELLQCYQQCDLFVLPNRTVNGDFEGFGMVLLEAQACGKPVIAGNSGGTRETMQCGSTGEIVDCEDVNRLAQAVVTWLQDKSKRKATGSAAREWVVDQFSWESLSQQAADRFGMTRDISLKTEPASTAD